MYPDRTIRKRLKRLTGLIAIVALMGVLMAVLAGTAQSASAQPAFQEGPDYAFFEITVDSRTYRNSWNLRGGVEDIPFFINVDVIAAGYETSVLNAFDTLADAPGSAISFLYMGATELESEVQAVGGVCCSSNVDDGVNVVSFGDLPPDERGVLLGAASLNGTIVFDSPDPDSQATGQFDITLAETADFTTTSDPSLALTDVESLVLHELGHVMGLDHPTDNPDSAMWERLPVGRVMRELHPADMYALSLLYPDSSLYPEFLLDQEVEFDDVPRGQYFSNAVTWAFANGITTGTSDTTFSPTAPVTRAQMATFLWRYAGEPAAGPHGFVDVPDGMFYSDAVRWLAESGVTTGTTATRFSPDDPVTRGQMAMFLWRFAGEPAGSATSFTDVRPGVFYATAVDWMADTGITIGTSATTFSPTDTLTRAQAVTFLWRLNRIP